MAYKTYTLTNLTNFTGRTASAFQSGFVETSAIPQALLLFKLATCIADPDALTAEGKQLVDFAILAMADELQLAAKNRLVASSPFTSETLGSYSYSKAAQAIQRGEETGVMWFDTAVRQLSLCDSTDGSFDRGGIEVFESGGDFVEGSLRGNARLVSASEMPSVLFGTDPSVGESATTGPYGV